MQQMLIGCFLRRKSPEFAPEFPHPHGKMEVEWLEWTYLKTGCKIRRQFNIKEKTFGCRNLPMDGWFKTTQTIYQFQGFYWNSHTCNLNQGRDFNKTRGIGIAQRNGTQHI